jgi:ABC-type sugar transport system substrate-binding protein
LDSLRAVAAAAAPCTLPTRQHYFTTKVNTAFAAAAAAAADHDVDSSTPFTTTLNTAFAAAAAAADYEVEFINTFTKLAAMGATFNPDAYLHTETTLQLKF